MQTTFQDLRYACRQLRKNLSFTAMSIATLALGIGATTAVFSLIDTVLLHPLPYAHPDRLVALDTLSQPRSGNGPATIPGDTSYPNFFDWRNDAHSFESMATYEGNSFTLGLSNAPAKRVDGMVVSAGFFHVLGIHPMLGRSFQPSEDQAGNRSVIISHSLWESAFDASPTVIGRQLDVNDVPRTIIGIMPPTFQFVNAPDAQVWTTPALAMEGKSPFGKLRGVNQVSVIARLAPGVSIAHARVEMQSIQRSLARQYPDSDATETAVSVVSELQDLVGDVQRPLNILFASVFFLLLIACANVAGLFLTRTAGRRSELALRSALGASRLQIIRQLLIESLTLSLLGGLGGFSLAAIALHLAPQFLPDDLPRIHELSLNPRVLLFCLVASVVTGLLFGVLPAWRNSRLDPALALNENARSGTASRSKNLLHSALVIGETALGLVLLVGAGLLMRSFGRLLSVDPGFNAQHLITFKVGIPSKRLHDGQMLQLSQQLQTRLAALPGVQQSTYANPLPLTGSNMNISFTIADRPPTPGKDPSTRASVVAGNFFQAMEISLRRGRFFGSMEDQPNSPSVVIINQAFADHFFPGEDPIGKHIESGLSNIAFGAEPKPREIVGIVGNVTRASLDEAPTPEHYIPFAQIPLTAPIFALRVAGDPAPYADTIRTIVGQEHPNIPVYAIKMSLLSRSTAQQRFQALLISAFALIALVLAAIGLYAVLSYMVVQRTLELGLRMALGAPRVNVLSLVLQRGLWLCTGGLALGLIASAALSRVLSTLLFHTAPLDVLTLTATPLLMLLVSVAACLVPAWRASRLSPSDTLRAQ